MLHILRHTSAYFLSRYSYACDYIQFLHVFGLLSSLVRTLFCHVLSYPLCCTIFIPYIQCLLYTSTYPSIILSSLHTLISCCHIIFLYCISLNMLFMHQVDLHSYRQFSLLIPSHPSFNGQMFQGYYWLMLCTFVSSDRVLSCIL